MFKLSFYIICLFVGIMAKRTEPVDESIIIVLGDYCLIVWSMACIFSTIDQQCRH